MNKPPEGYRPLLGIPYAEQRFVGRRVLATCPECGEDVELKVRKDFESRTGVEYAEHYCRVHGPAAGLLEVDGVWYERGEP